MIRSGITVQNKSKLTYLDGTNASFLLLNVSLKMYAIVLISKQNIKQTYVYALFVKSTLHTNFMSGIV